MVKRVHNEGVVRDQQVAGAVIDGPADHGDREVGLMFYDLRTGWALRHRHLRYSAPKLTARAR
jgi:hypothetical protein